ncbi:MAG: T9SS type A sorting domain-containing protein [Bacteroidetes bacterium]|nr:T9SS type A sorting domain-containing protein [Bacteroidota bacterium]
MNKTLLIIFSIFTMVKSYSQTVIDDSVSVGPGYINQVYYSFKNGVVKTINTNWDIAFQVSGIESSMMINSKNTNLYLVTNDTSKWSTFDTTGKISSTTILRNSDTSWKFGAFSRNSTISSGGFNVGWGTYDPISHIITGNNIYAIKLSDGTYRKLMIEKFNKGKYFFKYANLNGTNEIMDSLSASAFAGKNFAYYSLQTNMNLDLEPATGTWDLFFNQYQTVLPFVGAYSVVGAFTNLKRKAIKLYTLKTTSAYNLADFKSTRDVVGYDWKSFDNVTNKWSLADSTIYFVQDSAGDVYKMIFTGFGGGANGNINFSKQKVNNLPSALFESIEQEKAFVFPSLANSAIQVSTPISKNYSIQIYDMSGKTVFRSIEERAIESAKTISVEQFQQGTYIVQLAIEGEKVMSNLIEVSH